MVSIKNNKIFIALSILFASFFILFIFSAITFADSGGGGGGGGLQPPPIVWKELNGYAANTAIDMISFNCANDNSCGTKDYKVEIDTQSKDYGSGFGEIKGRAWNDEVGWISFDKADLLGCPVQVAGECQARIAWGADNGKFEGWARVLPLSHSDQQAQGITRGVDNGGWISLSCAYGGDCGSAFYEVSIDSITGFLSDFAWSDRIVDPLPPGTYSCGDVNADSLIDILDSNIILGSMLIPPTEIMARPDLCDVGGSMGCTSADSVIVMRAVANPPTATIMQQCPNGVAPGGVINWIDMSGVIADFSTPFGCYLDDLYGRKLIKWEDDGSDKLGYDGGANTLSINPDKVDEDVVPKGYYKATLATFDDNSSEDNDSWLLSFDSSTTTYSSSATLDLPSWYTYKEFIVDSVLSIVEDISGNSSFLAVYNESGDPPPAPPYESTLAPACLALDATCPFNPAVPGRTIIYFTDNGSSGGEYDTLLRSNDPTKIDAESGPFTTSIAIGSYDITIATYDSHSVPWNNNEFETDSANELDEGARVLLYTDPGCTGSVIDSNNSSDIPLGEDFLVEITNTGSSARSVTSPINCVKVRHTKYSQQTALPNDVTPLCVAFDYNGPLAQCTLTLKPDDVPGRIMIYFDGTEIGPGGSLSASIIQDQSGIVSAIPAGSYDVTLASSDENHPDSPDETEEKWYLELAGTAFTNTTTPDLSNGLLYDEFLPINITLNADATLATAVHASSISGNDFAPACAALDPIILPTTVSVTTPTPGIVAGTPATINWSIGNPDSVNGCTFYTTNTTDNLWKTKSSSSSPPLSNPPSYITPDLSNGTYIYSIVCRGTDGLDKIANAIIDVPYQCDDGKDNDGDGFCDFDGDCDAVGGNTLPDRGCTSATDNSELGELVCVTDILNPTCDPQYGENPINCPSDCSINTIEDI